MEISLYLVFKRMLSSILDFTIIILILFSPAFINASLMTSLLFIASCFVLMWSSKLQASPGQYLTKLKVIKLNGDRLSIIDTIIRLIAMIVIFILAKGLFTFAWLIINPSLYEYSDKIRLDFWTIFLELWGSAYFLSVIPLLFLPILFTKQKVMFHDILSKTQVVNAQ